jgi:7-cyano-7-deazaguanine synthase
MQKTVVIHSGGIDSTVLLAHLLSEGREVYALSVDYGQRHRREIEAAKKLCEFY